MNRTIKIFIVLILLALIGIGVYWYFFMRSLGGNIDPNTNNGQQNNQGGFNPISTGGVVTPNPTQSNTIDNSNTVATTSSAGEVFKLPKLRQLYSTPVAGISASTTASSTIFRFVDRGTGHIYEANDISNDIVKISNTTLPKMYEAYFNKNLDRFLFRFLKDDTDIVSNLYGELKPTISATSTTNQTPYNIKGKYLAPEINQMIVSPYVDKTGDKVFTWNIESEKGMGYISAFDEKTKVKIANTPITKVILDWPTKDILSINTKATASASGFLYTIDAKTGAMKKLLGGLKGLFGKINADASKTIYSASQSNSFITYLQNNKDGSSQEVIFKTLVDKCVWSKIRKDEVFCAVPNEVPDGVYPDDWYKGNVSFVDQIWHLDTTSGEVHLVANLLGISNKLIDATDLKLDPKENYLYFINKKDLTPWVLDLNQ